MSDDEITSAEESIPRVEPVAAPESTPEAETPPSTPTQTPWWVSDASSSVSTSLTTLAPAKRVIQVTWYIALAMSLIAGVVGALIGKTAFDNSTNLITSNKVIDRAPDSIAGIAARVSPSVVEIDSTTSTGSDTGSGFFIAKNGYIMTNNDIDQATNLATIGIHDGTTD